MKLGTKILSILSLGALVVVTGQEAMAATASFQTSAEVIDAIAITKDRDLSFGAFTPAGGGTVTIAPDASGTRTASGPTLSGSTNASASFSVAGDPNATFAITLPADSTITDGLNTMNVTFTSSGSGGAETLDGTGAATVYVGGTLTAAAGQVSGTYSGNFNLTVEYN